MRRSPNMVDQVGGHSDGIIAPVAGLNTQSALAGLSTDYAITLDNWICQPDSLVTRLGATSHATGFASSPKTLMRHSSATAAKVFAACASGIFDVTSTGAIGASVAACTSGFGKAVNFGISSGQYMYFCNGVDTPKLYDGTTWVSVTGVSAPAITGPTTTALFDVETYRQRLYFLHTDFLGFYYLPADSVGGAATAFRIGSLCRLGGKVVAHGTWSIDGGSGPDDHYALATSNGEVVVFHGSDPAVVANWTYVGTYYLGKPLGQNCFTKFGGDLLYLCENGLIPASSIVQSASLNYAKALTARIQPTIAAAAQAYGANSGWQVIVYPRQSLILLNVPLSSTRSIQYVYNSLSKGWSTFSGWNAASFLVSGDAVYFATGSIVAQAFNGASDFGANIEAICDTSYSRFGTREQLQPILSRALFASNGPVSYSMGLAQDFSGNYLENSFPASSTTAGVWDSGLWDTAIWGGGFELRRDWVTLSARGGLALSTRFRVSSLTSSTIFLSVGHKFAEQGLVS